MSLWLGAVKILRLRLRESDLFIGTTATLIGSIVLWAQTPPGLEWEAGRIHQTSFWRSRIKKFYNKKLFNPVENFQFKGAPRVRVVKLFFRQLYDITYKEDKKATVWSKIMTKKRRFSSKYLTVMFIIKISYNFDKYHFCVYALGLTAFLSTAFKKEKSSIILFFMAQLNQHFQCNIPIKVLNIVNII
jgi:hypothetical protein